MPTGIVFTLELKQILSYLNMEKDCELRKSIPDTKTRLNRNITEIPILIKPIGLNEAYIYGEISEVIKDNPSRIWSKYSGKLKFGISKKRFDSYYQKSVNAVLIHFKNVKLIYPPLTNVSGTVFAKYHKIPSNITLYPLSNDEVRKELLQKTKQLQDKLAARKK